MHVSLLCFQFDWRSIYAIPFFALLIIIPVSVYTGWLIHCIKKRKWQVSLLCWITLISTLSLTVSPISVWFFFTVTQAHLHGAHSANMNYLLLLCLHMVLSPVILSALFYVLPSQNHIKITLHKDELSYRRFCIIYSLCIYFLGFIFLILPVSPFWKA